LIKMVHKIEKHVTDLERFLLQKGFALTETGEVEGKGWREFRRGNQGITVHWWK